MPRDRYDAEPAPTLDDLHDLRCQYADELDLVDFMPLPPVDDQRGLVAFAVADRVAALFLGRLRYDYRARVFSVDGSPVDRSDVLVAIDVARREVADNPGLRRFRLFRQPTTLNVMSMVRARTNAAAAVNA